jgi:hypothetical protein
VQSVPPSLRETRGNRYPLPSLVVTAAHFVYEDLLQSIPDTDNVSCVRSRAPLGHARGSWLGKRPYLFASETVRPRVLSFSMGSLTPHIAQCMGDCMRLCPCGSDPCGCRSRGGAEAEGRTLACLPPLRRGPLSSSSIS